MLLYYCLFSILALSLSGLLLRHFVRSKKNITDGLFAEALRNENSGHYEEAVIAYENALDEVRKTKYSRGLESKISQKLKVLHNIIEYKNNFHAEQAA